MTTLSPRVQLRSLSVEGFRGVNKPVRVDFGPRATVFSARNGRGKSTLLGAIEWGLFGDLKFQPPENRTHDELVSLFHPAGRASVQLGLTRKGEEIRVRRMKTLGKMGSMVEVQNGGAQPLENDLAQEFLFQLLGLSFEDFYRAAFLHQDSIRGLLTEEQKDRDEALDRLLGVETIRNILTSIPAKFVTNALREIEANESKILERLAGAGTMAETTRTHALQDAVELGYSEEDLALKTGQREAKELQSALQTTCKKFGAEAPEEIPVESSDDLERIARKIKAATRDIRLSVGMESPLDSAVGRIGELKTVRAELESAVKIVAAAKEKLDAHLKEHGTAKDWEKTSAQATANLKATDAALHVLDAHGRVIEDAIAYLEAVPKAKECPVCGDPQEGEELATRLKGLVKRDQAAAVRRLNASAKVARTTLQSLEELQEERSHLKEGLDGAQDDLEEVKASAWKTLGEKSSKQDPLELVVSKEKEISESLGELRNAGKKREAQLDALDDGAERIRCLHRFLKAESDAERVRQKAAQGEGGGAQAFEEDKRRLTALKGDLDAIIQALNGLAAGRAQTALERCGPDISRVYGQLCNHPYFDGLRIEVSQKVVSGVQRNTYRIIAFSTKEGEKTSASSRLSTAQMNSVALSAYLSLSKVLTHNLGFILLDDPSQNLDTEHKRALAQVLKELLPSTQLVIGTHDAEFDSFLRDSLGKEGLSWYDLGWAPRDGTTLKAMNPGNG